MLHSSDYVNIRFQATGTMSVYTTTFEVVSLTYTGSEITVVEILDDNSGIPGSQYNQMGSNPGYNIGISPVGQTITITPAVAIYQQLVIGTWYWLRLQVVANMELYVGAVPPTFVLYGAQTNTTNIPSVAMKITY